MAELMLVVGGRPWPMSLKTTSPAFRPTASEKVRTVMGRPIGVLPLRWTVPGGLGFLCCL